MTAETETTEVLDVSALTADEYQGAISDAIDLASDRDTATWLVIADGRRIAALVPVEVLEHYEASLSRVLTGRHHAAVLRP